MNRTLQGPGGGDVAEQPIQELSALRNVQPPAALVARVMTQLAEPRQLSTWQWLRRPIPIEIRLSPIAIVGVMIALAALFVVIGATMK